MKKEFIFFDLDGTLTDSSPGIINSLSYALGKLGITIENREELSCFIGPPLVDMMMEVFGFSKEKAEQGLVFYREYFRDKGIFENSVYEGIPALLETLQQRGYKLVLATSKPEVYAKRILEHFDIAKYFYYVGGSDMEGLRATKEAVIEHNFAALGNPSPQKCIMVGDRKYDVVGSREYGFDCVGVLYGYGSREELEAVNAAYIAETVTELGEILQSM